MEVRALPFVMRREVIIMMMCPMWIWGIVGVLLIVLLIVVIAKLLKK